MQTLITAKTLTFNKPNCACGIVSNKRHKQFIATLKTKKNHKYKKKYSRRTKNYK
jgi:ribosomal protein S17